MASHHEPLQAMSPVDWDQVPQDNLNEFLENVFTECQTVIESIPAPTTTITGTGRARSQTESAVPTGDMQQVLSHRQKASSAAQARDLGKEWKEIKVNPKENPLDIVVYKLAAKDGKGAWFARRSVHEGLTFDKWKQGLEMEFGETMKTQGSPGSGNIRGIGADKRVAEQDVADAGHLQVFQLSAQFPGPTSPRDFVTLLLTSETKSKPKALRQFMIVSKPCEHPECPPRQGFIRGYYESVEIIREVPIENPTYKRSLSSADLSTNDGRRQSAAPNGERDESSRSAVQTPTAIEWLMVTRSDPGGTVPRFLIEKGTPPGIVGDAGKFLKWVTAKAGEGLSPSTGKDEATAHDSEQKEHEARVPNPATPNLTQDEVQTSTIEDTVPSSNGLYGMITGAFGATTGFLGRLGPYGSDLEAAQAEGSSDARVNKEKDGEDEKSLSDTSSIRSFASALEKSVTAEDKSPESTAGSHSEENKSNATTQHEKELKKLQDRRRKLDEKVARMEQRRNSKLQGGKEKDAAAVAKMREKHEKDMAKQEDKYRRELRRLEEKREHEQRKAEEKRRKAADREDKSRLTLELEKVRAERDVALKQVDILENQVGELQAQNTMLVRKLGKLDAVQDPDSAGAG